MDQIAGGAAVAGSFFFHRCSCAAGRSGVAGSRLLRLLPRRNNPGGAFEVEAEAFFVARAGKNWKFEPLAEEIADVVAAEGQKLDRMPQAGETRGPLS